MASSPLSTLPTSLNDLPPELRCTLTKYLGEKDLANMRLLSSYWNTIAKTTLRKRKRLVFNFEDVDKLAEFNDTFSAYTPTEDIAAARFRFELPALDTAAATAHLDTFVQKFGGLVTSLSLILFKFRPFSGERPQGWGEWVGSPKSETVLAHVTLLLDKVRGQVQDLELMYYAGLQPLVIGHGPFPRLQTLTVARNPYGAHEAAVEEACILLLARTVPAIQRFEFKEFYGSNDGDPVFLANVLRALVQVNGQVEVKLELELSFYAFEENSALLAALMTVAVRVVELDLSVNCDHDILGRALQWIGAQSDWLRKLTFKVELGDAEAALGGLRLPSLRALEELNYDQKTVESLIQYEAPDYFPSLRTVTTAAAVNDFTVTLPQVTDLTLVRTWVTGVGARELGKYGQALFQLPPFPNLETLTCPVKFIDLGSVVGLRSLRRLTLTPDEQSRHPGDAFWKRMAHGAWKLTLEQIRALPEPSEEKARSRAEPSFSDLPNLQELKLVVDRNDVTVVRLEALLFLSKSKRLQRLRKVELEMGTRFVTVPQVYVNELTKYHNSVIVSQPKIANELM